MNNDTKQALHEIAGRLGGDLFSMSPEYWTNGTAEDMIAGALAEAMQLATLETTGRTDLDNFFKMSGLMESPNLNHTPFLVFHRTEDGIVVNTVTSAVRVASDFPPESKVMVQWPGRWRSDFFKMTVADIRAELEARRKGR